MQILPLIVAKVYPYFVQMLPLIFAKFYSIFCTGVWGEEGAIGSTKVKKFMPARPYYQTQNAIGKKIIAHDQRNNQTGMTSWGETTEVFNSLITRSEWSQNLKMGTLKIPCNVPNARLAGKWFGNHGAFFMYLDSYSSFTDNTNILFA